MLCSQTKSTCCCPRPCIWSPRWRGSIPSLPLSFIFSLLRETWSIFPQMRLLALSLCQCWAFCFWPKKNLGAALNKCRFNHMVWSGSDMDTRPAPNTGTFFYSASTQRGGELFFFVCFCVFLQQNEQNSKYSKWCLSLAATAAPHLRPKLHLRKSLRSTAHGTRRALCRVQTLHDRRDTESLKHRRHHKSRNGFNACMLTNKDYFIFCT